MQFTKRDINKQNRNGEVSFYNVGDTSSQSSSGGVTLDQVRRNFVSIEFFKKLFQAHDSTDSENILNIDPNDTDSTITDLEFKFGSWSSYFISALGRNSSGGGGGGSVGVLNDLDDVDTTGAANGKVLTYQNGMWVPGTGGGSGSVSWADITDKPTTLSGYGITDAIPLAGSDRITGKLEPNTNNSIDLGSSDYRWRYVYGVTGSFSSGLTVGGTSVSLAGHTHSASDITSGTFAAARIPTLAISKISGLQDALDAKLGTNANAASATKLNTTRTLWGQSFDGTANVSGNMTSVGSITATGDITVTKSNAKISVHNGSTEIGLNNDNNRGVWDYSTSRWLITTNGTNSWLNCGDVGIGTNSPSYKLHVAGNGCFTNYLTLRSDLYIYNAKTIYFKDSDGTDRSVLNFSANNNINIGYGTYSLGSGLYIYGKTLVVRIGGTSATYNALSIDASKNATFSGNILATGAVTALSDMRRKSPVSEVNTKIEDLASLPIFYYKWKMGYDDDMHIGTSAQEVQKLFPELVIGKEDLSVNYPVLGTTLGILNSRKLTTHEKEIKSSKKEIKALRERIKVLEDRQCQ